MKEIRVGYSKIYNAEGCHLLGREEIILPFLVNEIEVRVFVGSEHKHHIGVFSESGSNKNYKDKSVQIHPAPKIYPADLYTEILALQTIQVEDDIAEAFENRNEKAKEFIGSKAKELHPNLSIATDYIAGLMGLRLHNNLVRKLITEQSYEYCNLSNKYSIRAGLKMNVIPSIEWDISEGNLIAFPKLKKAWKLEKAAEILAWVLRAWDAEDPILRFVSLFIPLEIVVKKFNNINKAPNEIDIWDKQHKEILKIVQQTSIDNKEMVNFLNGLQKPSPSISKGFEKLAKDSKLPGWEQDIIAFNKFNRMRNDLVHAGKTVESKISVTENEVRTLEDITAKYVSYALYGDAKIYQLPARQLSPQ